MFKLTDTKKRSEVGAWVHIKDNGRLAYLDDAKKKPVRIKVLGPHSGTLQSRARKRIARRLKENGGSIDMSKMSQIEIEAFLENSENAASENWADATLSWENMPNPDGEGTIDFSPEAAEMIYEAYPMIVAQLKDEAEEINDFLSIASVK